MRRTLRSISNSCSNYKIPEGLVINCEDALRRRGWGGWGGGDGRDGPWLTFSLSESICVPEDAVQRMTVLMSTVVSAFQGYVGLPAFNPQPPPTPTPPPTPPTPTPALTAAA